MGVGAEVADPLAARSPVDHQPGVFLVEGDGQHRIGLVVAIADVEPRVELLDPVVFELQGFHLGGHHGPLDLGRGGDHLPGAGVQPGDVGEVGRQAGTQALGFAHVDDPTMRIGEAVDPGLDGDGPGRRSVRGGIGHGSKASHAGVGETTVVDVVRG